MELCDFNPNPERPDDRGEHAIGRAAGEERGRGFLAIGREAVLQLLMEADVEGVLLRGRWDRQSYTQCKIWLGDLDSNQGCPVQSREFYR